MQVIESVKALQHWRASLNNQQSIGFVPTMGALHAGHESLLKKSKNENPVSVLSIYVNQTQFNNPDDFKHYPQTWESDLEIAKKNQVDVLFRPSYTEMYPDQYTYKLSEQILSQDLCGADRPGHFDGVLTVVLKLFNLIQAERAYFGEKDFQQLSLIKGMAKAFFIQTEVIAVPTVREENGLAMSSRNLRLSREEREKASEIYKTITSVASLEKAKEILIQKGFQLDYLKDLELNGNEKRRFVAAKIGAVRLIDNVKI